MMRIRRSVAFRGEVADRDATMHVGLDGVTMTTGNADEYLIADMLVEAMP